MPRILSWLYFIVARLPRRITFSFALALSLAAHAVLLAIHFKLPSRLSQASQQMIEVILVNAKSSKPPTHAQARAQAHLDGGGNTDQQRVAKTPLPATRATRDGDKLVEARRKIAEMEAQTQRLLSQLNKTQHVVSSDQAHTPTPEPQPTRNTPAAELVDAAMAMARLQGQIDRHLDEYSKRPRKKYIGARATEYRFAQYEEDWRQKVERIGNLNYPAAARGKLYGTLVITVEIRSDGTIDSITVDRPSGKKLLDDAAIRIIRQSAPFPPFPPSLNDTDIIGITRTWSFTNEDRMQAN